jgi:hypothetical protein
LCRRGASRPRSLPPRPTRPAARTRSHASGAVCEAAYASACAERGSGPFLLPGRFLRFGLAGESWGVEACRVALAGGWAFYPPRRWTGGSGGGERARLRGKGTYVPLLGGRDPALWRRIAAPFGKGFPLGNRRAAHLSTFAPSFWRGSSPAWSPQRSALRGLAEARRRWPQARARGRRDCKSPRPPPIQKAQRAGAKRYSAPRTGELVPSKLPSRYSDPALEQWVANSPARSPASAPALGCPRRGTALRHKPNQLVPPAINNTRCAAHNTQRYIRREGNARAEGGRRWCEKTVAAPHPGHPAMTEPEPRGPAHPPVAHGERTPLGPPTETALSALDWGTRGSDEGQDEGPNPKQPVRTTPFHGGGRHGRCSCTSTRAASRHRGGVAVPDNCCGLALPPHVSGTGTGPAHLRLPHTYVTQGRDRPLERP